MSTTTFTSGSGNWVADATQADVECWGGGANGLTGGAGSGSAGGGGGEYSIKHVTGLTIGNSYAYVVGGAGADSTFQATTVVAKGASGATGGTGGTGDTKHAGGNGGSGATGGGGGGGSGGTAAVGNPGTGASGGTGGAGATAVSGGGAGGRGGDTPADANIVAGSAPGGGGGGGAASLQAGAAGAAGQVRITSPDNPPAGLSAQINQIVRTWWNPPDPQPVQKGPVAPLALTYGDQPPPQRQQTIPGSAWDQPPAIQPIRSRIAPLIPIVVTADNPPPIGVRNQIHSNIITAWDTIPFAKQPLGVGATTSIIYPYVYPHGTWAQMHIHIKDST